MPCGREDVRKIGIGVRENCLGFGLLWSIGRLFFFVFVPMILCARIEAWPMVYEQHLRFNLLLVWPDECICMETTVSFLSLFFFSVDAGSESCSEIERRRGVERSKAIEGEKKRKKPMHRFVKVHGQVRVKRRPDGTGWVTAHTHTPHALLPIQTCNPFLSGTLSHPAQQ